ncbi:MAG TPA: GNAT family N-acetyltransferase [Chitinophagaceae bacterium]|jgi:ribosomal protein S18 acetylase RimI-like enzyme|nr:GNAT family N-acetyltransferase [Chitinophagaceae bacterium]
MTTAALSVRRAGPEDLDALSALFDAYRVFYNQPSDVAAARRFLHERFTHLQSVLFLAELNDNQTPVGFTQLYPAFSSVSMQRTWILNDLYVYAEYRGLHAGKALLDAARSHALATGAKGLLLETGIANERAQRLYEQYGFRKEEGSLFYFLTVPSAPTSQS